MNDTSPSSGFSAPSPDRARLEEGKTLTPRFDDNGLLAVITTDADNGTPLMLAYMNKEALRLTLETRIAHYYSRSRQAIWKKGEQSGHHQEVVDIRIDCDQDALWLSVHQHGPGCCHVGYRSCFYRRLEQDDSGQVCLVPVGDKVYAPDRVYGPTK